MKKTYIITFGITVLIMITVAVIALMVLLPQQSTIIDAGTTKYEAIKKSDFVYQQTKDITKDALVKEYTISNEEIEKFKVDHKYVSGNSDPFTPNNVDKDNSNNNTNVGSSASSSTSSNTSDDTTQKITNSNGGQPNPPSTNK